MTAKIIATANEKGGAGKTTTAVTCAHEAVARGHRALIIELDGQRNASQWLTGRDFNDWFDLTMANVMDTKLALSMRARLEDIIVPTDRPGLDVAPAADTSRMDEVNHTIAGRADGPISLQKLLTTVAGNYDYIFIDCAPSTTPLNIAGYVAAETGILVVAAPQQAAHAGAISLLTALRKLTDPDNEQHIRTIIGRDIPIVGIVLNNYNAHKLAHQEFRRDFNDLADAFDIPVIGDPIPALSLMELVPPSGHGLDEVTGARDGSRADEIRATFAAILAALD